MHYFTGFTLSCFLILVGCAAPQATRYQATSAENEFGYTQTQLTDTQHRIEFVGNRFTEASRIKDYAMLRAAELTIQKGYDWFTILTSETDRETKTRSEMLVSGTASNQVVRQCGLLGCSSYVTPGYSGARLETYVVDGKVSTSLQISMGKGEAPDPSSAFNAKELATNMRQNIK
ncbi:hypothetical protein [uncultured Paraglaciecola sp.]|uniref:CC0125/CC1285 family lipoprotein n=1 Tax=uncultured Paraglaciecola sp. TaxID=1765024 RepID=UPI0030D974C8|tara:strand:+ start:43372 stop:43896 length:525 start_codon:yes stop_codon:yes gene_type:complete